MKASKALTVSMSVFRGQIPWRFSLSKNISPAAPDLELILFPLWYWAIMNTHTKQQQEKVFEMDFIDSQKSNPPFVHILARSHIYSEKTASLLVLPFFAICAVRFGCCICASPVSLGCRVAALLVRTVLILQNMPEAKLVAFETSLIASSVAVRTCLTFPCTTCLHVANQSSLPTQHLGWLHKHCYNFCWKTKQVKIKVKVQGF